MHQHEVCTLVVEPESWRFLGLSTFLSASGLRVAGDPQCELKTDGITADVVLLAHQVILRNGERIIDRIRGSYPATPVLVYGDVDCIRTIASLLARGVQGYFELSSPQEQLLDAIDVVRTGGVWAPRAALVLLTHREQLEPGAFRDREPEDRIMRELLSAGLSNKEIGARLGLAEVTIKARLTRLYRRYGVRTRLQLLSSMMRDESAN